MQQDRAPVFSCHAPMPDQRPHHRLRRLPWRLHGHTAVDAGQVVEELCAALGYTRVDGVAPQGSGHKPTAPPQLPGGHGFNGLLRVGDAGDEGVQGGTHGPGVPQPLCLLQEGLHRGLGPGVGKGEGHKAVPAGSAAHWLVGGWGCVSKKQPRARGKRGMLLSTRCWYRGKVGHWVGGKCLTMTHRGVNKPPCCGFWCTLGSQARIAWAARVALCTTALHARETYRKPLSKQGVHASSHQYVHLKCIPAGMTIEERT